MTPNRCRHRVDRALTDDRGGVAPLYMIMFAALVALAGLAYDGGNLFAARREANNVAAAAARAGANDLTEASIYAGDPELAPSAPGTAMSFAMLHGATTANASRVEHDLIQVRVTRTISYRFLPIVGLTQGTVSGEAEARVRDSVRGP